VVVKSGESAARIHRAAKRIFAQVEDATRILNGKSPGAGKDGKNPKE
jgi:hypothetical protein